MHLQTFIKQKKLHKKDLAKELELDLKQPMLAVVVEEDLKPKQEETLAQVVEGLKSLNVGAVILGDAHLEELADKNVKFREYNRKNRKEILEATDIAVVFKANDVEELLWHGTIPVSSARGELADYDPNSESGNAFIYEKKDQWSIFAAVVRAVETYKFTYDWKHIMRNGLESVCKREEEGLELEVEL